MSVLGTLFGRIFHHNDGGAAAGSTATASAGSAQASPASGTAPQPNAPAAQNRPAGAATAGAAPASAAPAGAASAGTATMERVDIEQVLNGMAAKNPQKLNWRNSIVDLMKLVGMDSSLQERKQLADELGYQGDRNDTATMNVWLHKEVMKKMQENGGKVPADLLD